MSSAFRDVVVQAAKPGKAGAGRRFVVAIGIDRYRSWPRLSNAVSDATAVVAAFERLGFEPLGALYNEAATADAMRQLVADDLAKLRGDDSLIVVFAGHGHTVTRKFEDGDAVKTGYLIPCDAEPPGGSMTEWLRLDSWLSDIARLEAKHILVILDACHSGVALDAVVKWRGGDSPTDSFNRLRQRRSRKVITSAQDDQRALDSGPRPGHSLFTGCLLDGLDGDLAQYGPAITGSQLGQYLQRRVTSYPQSTQTPDFGAFEGDRRGELVIPIPGGAAVEPSGVPAPAVARRRWRPGRSWLVLAMSIATIVAAAWTAGQVQSMLRWSTMRPLGPQVADIVEELRERYEALEAQYCEPGLEPDIDTDIDTDTGIAVVPGPKPEPSKPPPAPSPVVINLCRLSSDDVHARPQRLRGKTCPPGCLDSQSPDVPVRVPDGAFNTCSHVCVCSS